MTGVLALLIGQGRPVVTLSTSYSASDTTVAPTNANARFKLEADGDIIKTLVTGGATDLGDWIVPKAAAGGNYEAKSTLTSGTLSADPSAGSWVALSSDREWGLARTTNGISTAIFTLDIRRVGTTVTLASATVTLSAERTV